jgi:hypothetical protein
LALSGAAQAITDNVFRYTNPRTGHFPIHAMAMAPDGDSSANDYFIDCRLSTGNIRCSTRA